MGLVGLLLLLLAHPAPVAQAAPRYLMVQPGATGDCVALPCGSVQQAIGVADPGDVVMIATGIYTENLSITKSVTLEGGWSIAFTLRDPDSIPTWIVAAISTVHNLRVESTTPLTAPVAIDGVNLRGGQDGIHIWSGDVTAVDCTIENVAKQGVEIDGGTVLISGTRVFTAQQGIEVDAGAVQVEGATIAHTTQEGLLVEGADVVTFTGSLIEHAGQQGVQINTGEVSFAGNEVRHVISDGIRVNGGTVTLADNVIHDITGADGPGIYVVGTPGNIFGNQVYAVADRGIYVRTADATMVAGNTVYDVANDGIYVRDGGAVTVSANTVYSASERGIYVRGGSAAIVDNTVHDTGDDGIRTYSTNTDVDIRGNTVTAAGNDGVDARGARVQVRGNTITGSGDNGIKADEIGQWVRIEANWILSNTTFGIAVRVAPDFSLINNIVGDHPAGSVELGSPTADSVRQGLAYHNTLVGSGTGQQGVGVAVLDPLTATLVNNIVVSHTLGITVSSSALPTATLWISRTLLWGNGDDPYTGTLMLNLDPQFADPPYMDYHIRETSPAVDQGLNAGVTIDIDGDPRPNGMAPDLGADELPAGYHIYLPLILRVYPLPPPEADAYLITADPADLAWLAEDPYRDETIPATFFF
jgi:parallel beta-helix repeat protein